MLPGPQKVRFPKSGWWDTPVMALLCPTPLSGTPRLHPGCSSLTAAGKAAQGPHCAPPSPAGSLPPSSTSSQGACIGTHLWVWLWLHGNGTGPFPHPPPKTAQLLASPAAPQGCGVAGLCVGPKGWATSPLCTAIRITNCSQNHSSSSFPRGWGCRGLGGETCSAERGEGSKATKGYRTLYGNYFSLPCSWGSCAHLAQAVPGRPCRVPCEALGTGKGCRVMGTSLSAQGLVPHSQGNTGIHPLLDCSLAVPQEQRDHPASLGQL